jgi:hypothetical protein
VSLKI